MKQPVALGRFVVQRTGGVSGVRGAEVGVTGARLSYAAHSQLCRDERLRLYVAHEKFDADQFGNVLSELCWLDRTRQLARAREGCRRVTAKH